MWVDPCHPGPDRNPDVGCYSCRVGRITPGVLPSGWQLLTWTDPPMRLALPGDWTAQVLTGVVSGVGVSAQGKAVVISGVTHASLYVDFGTFGMLIVTDTTTATLDMSVALAKALK